MGRSPAAVTRAVAALEDRLGTRLFNRTTRAVALTDAGLRHLDRSRRVLEAVASLEAAAATERAGPSGSLTVTAPVVFGRLHVLPVVCAFLRAFPAVDVRLVLLDRVVSLLDEGIDVGIRIGDLPDSSLKAIRVGSVRRRVYASPGYLSEHGTPANPAELADHACIAFAATPSAAVRWSFGPAPGGRAVSLRPRLAVNTAEAAIDAARSGLGLTRVLSYQAEPFVAAGSLRPVLTEFEGRPVPIHIVHPAGRHLAPKVRLFIEQTAEALRVRFDGAGETAQRR